MRKIAVITGTRAEYGLLYWIIKDIYEDPDLELQLIVTCMHLSPEFGLTVREIERDGFPIADKVEMLLSSDTDEAIATSMGLGMIGFAKTYKKLDPDIVVVLGDRFEILAAVAATVPFRIPVAHIHGGEATEGAMDELFRHAITKMSHIHFVATRKYEDRIVHMGEQPKNVFCFGAPGLDNVYKLKLLNRQQLEQQLDLPDGKPLGVMTYHPVTIGNEPVKEQIEELLSALDEIPEIFWIFTSPNADAQSRGIIEIIVKYARRNSTRCKFFASIGQLRYLSLLKNAVVMVGNSSSGIIEAPSFELPVVNVSDRQKGRVRAANVLDVPVCKKNEVIKAIKKAVSADFKKTLRGLKNPYGDNRSSERIVEVFKKVSLSEILKKQFYELEFGK
jgi:UDP-N-acetylglucosamine 2-epimerase (non-hydrolysing)/GDP/UDP-N,N'-diacetylbacillosamine 2-epimerase (hydrolysing)